MSDSNPKTETTITIRVPKNLWKYVGIGIAAVVVLVAAMVIKERVADPMIDKTGQAVSKVTESVDNELKNLTLKQVEQKAKEKVLAGIRADNNNEEVVLTDFKEVDRQVYVDTFYGVPSETIEQIDPGNDPQSVEAHYYRFSFKKASSSGLGGGLVVAWKDRLGMWHFE